MCGFIKYMRTEESEFLLKYPNANHLLSVMAYRARRTDHALNGLKAGQCFLGDIDAIGMSRQQYRTAKSQLEKWGLVSFIATNKGTIGTILNTKVYDINSDDANQQGNHQTNHQTNQQTNQQGNQQTNQRVTTNKECKKERKEEVKDLMSPEDDESLKSTHAKNSDAIEVLKYLNEKLGTKYKHTSKTHIQNINARLANHSLEDLKMVIDFKIKEWTGTEWAKFLRPQTLFQDSKFEGYLLAAKSSHAKPVRHNGNYIPDWDDPATLNPNSVTAQKERDPDLRFPWEPGYDEYIAKQGAKS